VRIAIVNDKPIAIETMRQVLAHVEGYEIAWVAYNGLKAVEKCAQDTPDLILMDLTMPFMDGAEATRRIMQETPCAILVVTDSVNVDASKVFEAMGYGALDAVNIPVLQAQRQISGGDALLRKVATVGKLIDKPATPAREKGMAEEITLLKQHLPPLVAIGSSTGGPQALAKVLSCLPQNFRAAVVIIQHVDVKFAHGLASWLNERTPLSVRAVCEGCRPEVGTVWLAATNDHLILTRDFRFHYTPHPRDCPFRPSVDVFFKTLAEIWPRKAVAVLLTGMGKDGAQGLLSLRREGWHTIVKDKESSVVYGMPKAAIELGAAVDILPIDQIGPALARCLNSSGSGDQLQRRST
jgi:two-component system response regulator WspF